ncbi:MAG TPA: porin family protein [Puia sp.]|jgi:hypothetical protein|nr:porin family protein [Puia sp.]
MKKLALLILAGSFFATANAQFAFGIKAGANFSNASGDGLSGLSTSTLTGFNGGVFFKLPIGGHLSIQPELVYSGQGFKADENGYTATFTENYINIPVLLKYRFPMGLFIETGPQIGFLMSANAKYQGVSASDKSNYTSTDFDWAVGAGFHIPTTKLAVDVRYNIGLANIASSSSNTGSSSSNTVHNNVFQIGLMYTLFSAPVK